MEVETGDPPLQQNGGNEENTNEVDDETNAQQFRKEHNTLAIWGRKTSMNLNNLVLENILQSPYFRNKLSALKTLHELVDEIYYNVTHLEPWEKGTRKTTGQTGMCGGVRGVGAGGVVSTPFCIMYRLFTLKLTRKQLYSLLNHADSPYIRGIGFMYIRFCLNPSTFWDWYERYLEDEEQVDPRAGGGDMITIGQMVKMLLTKLDWYSTLFPRIPVPVQKELDAKMREHEMKKRTENNLEVEKADESRVEEAKPRERSHRDRSRSRDRSRRTSKERHGSKSKGDRKRSESRSPSKHRKKSRSRSRSRRGRSADRHGRSSSSVGKKRRSKKRSSRSRSNSKSKKSRHDKDEKNGRTSTVSGAAMEKKKEHHRHHKKKQHRRRSRSRSGSQSKAAKKHRSKSPSSKSSRKRSKSPSSKSKKSEKSKDDHKKSETESKDKKHDHKDKDSKKHHRRSKSKEKTIDDKIDDVEQKEQRLSDDESVGPEEENPQSSIADSAPNNVLSTKQDSAAEQDSAQREKRAQENGEQEEGEVIDEPSNDD